MAAARRSSLVGWQSVRKRAGFATSEVQISETETPLYRLEKVYRRINERLATSDTPDGAFRNIIDAWFFTLEQDVWPKATSTKRTKSQLVARTNDLMEQRLASLGETAQTFSLGTREDTEKRSRRTIWRPPMESLRGSLVSPTSQQPPNGTPASRATSTTLVHSPVCRACSPFCEILVSLDCSSCWTKSRPFSVCEVMCGRRALTH